MADSAEIVPRDDRAWPRGSAFFSVVLVVAAVGTGVGLVVSAAGRGPVVMGATLIGFLVVLGSGFGVFTAAFRHKIAGHPVPVRFEIFGLAAVLVAFVFLYAVDAFVGGAMLAGFFGGAMGANFRAIRTARANRELVDTREAEAARAHDRHTTSDEAQSGPLAYGAGATPSAPVGHVLHKAFALECRRSLAWLIAGGVVTTACLVLGAPRAFTFGVAFMGGLALAWVLRRLWGVWLARRKFVTAATSPRRAFVVLLADPSPQGIRPLLGIWSESPIVQGGRMPPPEQVYRCGDERDALECHQGNLVVHEAWVDTGPRPTSKPRWVAADAGIALPHRRPIFLGRWYMSSLVRGERPGRLERLTQQSPHPDTEASVDTGGDRGNYLAALALRLAGLATAGLLFSWLA